MSDQKSGKADSSFDEFLFSFLGQIKYSNQMYKIKIYTSKHNYKEQIRVGIQIEQDDQVYVMVLFVSRNVNLEQPWQTLIDESFLLFARVVCVLALSCRKSLHYGYFDW